MAELSAVIDATRKLLSPAAPQVLSLLGQREPELETLRRAVDLDPVLTVKIMNHANHSFYARQVPVASLSRALVRLGWEASCELLTRLVMEGASHAIDPRLGRPIWERSVRVAVLARILARTSGRVDPALAYTAGLVHGIGQLGLVALLQDRYVALWRAAPGGPHLARDERHTLGFDHARVGSGVLETLSLPPEIPGAVRRMYRARLAERDWTGRPDLVLASLLQLTQILLYDVDRHMQDAAWLAEQPLAIALGVHEAADLKARYHAAIEQQLEQAA